jgi:hypothetical protein
MFDRSGISDQFAFNLLKAQDAARDLAESASSINSLVARTRTTITESRLLLAQADKLLAPDTCFAYGGQRDQPPGDAVTPTLLRAATRSPAE